MEEIKTYIVEITHHCLLCGWWEHEPDDKTEAILIWCNKCIRKQLKENENRRNKK